MSEIAHTEFADRHPWQEPGEYPCGCKFVITSKPDDPLAGHVIAFCEHHDVVLCALDLQAIELYKELYSHGRGADPTAH